MLSRSFKKVTYPLRYRNLNSPLMRIGTHVDVYEPSEADYRTRRHMFLFASGSHIYSPQWGTNMASPYKAL